PVMPVDPPEPVLPPAPPPVPERTTLPPAPPAPAPPVVPPAPASPPTGSNFSQLRRAAPPNETNTRPTPEVSVSGHVCLAQAPPVAVSAHAPSSGPVSESPRSSRVVSLCAATRNSTATALESLKSTFSKYT